MFESLPVAVMVDTVSPLNPAPKMAITSVLVFATCARSTFADVFPVAAKITSSWLL